MRTSGFIARRPLCLILVLILIAGLGTHDELTTLPITLVIGILATMTNREQLGFTSYSLPKVNNAN